MDRKTHEEAKETLKKVTEVLNDKTLTDEERREMELQKAALAGAILNPWLPFGWVRRLIMVGIVALGVYGLVEENYQVFLSWLLLPCFSPRIVGEISYFLGKLSRGG